jgi:hypothetical protein
VNLIGAGSVADTPSAIHRWRWRWRVRRRGC